MKPAAIPWVLGVTALVGPLPAAAQAFPPALTEDEAREVRTAIDAMKRDPRGPYLRLRWFCSDGSVHPPAGSPCVERGGGVQHAEYGEAARRLAQLAVHVGTILQATGFDELRDAARGGYRLQELVLANYLFEIDDGWALRRARFYRGARQIEDEEAKGQAFLEWLLAQRGWASDNFLLAAQLAATIPHESPGGAQATTRIRNLATEVAALDTAFDPLRVKIHSFPSRDDLQSVETYLAGRTPSEEARGKLTQLRDELGRQYDARRAVQTLAAYQRRLRSTLGDDLPGLQGSLQRGDARQALTRIAALGRKIRGIVAQSGDGRTNLALLDLNRVLQEQAFVLAQDLQAADARPTPRTERLRRLAVYFDLAVAAGFLSPREQEALTAEAERLVAAGALAALEYRHAVAYLGRSLDWAMATARGAFGPAHDRYLSFEPKAAGFLDAMVRGSILLPLAGQLDRLATDADSVLGASHSILGAQVSQGVRGLNPGAVLAPLEIVLSGAPGRLDPAKIYLLPETTPELKPVAGLLTLDAGNLLSHMQLLARNLGIPNAAVASTVLPRLQNMAGKSVFYAVSPLGRVLLRDPADLSAAERSLVDESRRATTGRVKLTTARLRLDRTAPIPLRDLRADASGVVVGPKAANLGQLAAFFPDQVADGVALPFGMFYRHANRRLGDADRTVIEELEGAYRRGSEMRAAGQSEAEIDRFMLGALARVRQAILDLEWLPEMRQAVADAVRVTFGAAVAQGVFVRSDTNVEDLPQFSGAGLNLTVPNQRSVEDILVAIKRVWTSPFSERAYLWRKEILDEQGKVYPSVLLLRSVPSEKSGVMITSGLQAGGPRDVTIATAEGVAGAVEGEEAETIVVDPAGTVRLLAQAKAPVKRVLVPGRDGAVVVPADRPEYLLTPADVRRLLRVAREWRRRFAPTDTTTVWDVEFGFVGDKLWLFQIRPFVRFRSSQLLERLAVLDREVLARGSLTVSLRESP